MTLVETHIPSPAETVTETERRARILEAAALEIEVRGWARGTESAIWQHGGRVCLVGGILAVIEAPVVSANCPNYERAGTIFGRADAWRFNDLVAESADEVTFLLRWRAEEIRDNEATA